MYMVLVTHEQLTNLYENAAFIISESHIIRTLEHGHAPHSLQTVIKGALQTVRVSLPNANSACSKQETPQRNMMTCNIDKIMSQNV